MPAIAIQKNALLQCRCTNGANRGRNLRLGAFVSVSLGLMFWGTASLPFKRALPTTAFCRGKLRRLSVPGPIVFFLTNLVAVPCLKLRAVPFFTKVDLLLMLGLCSARGCTEREGAFTTVRPL